MKLLVNHKSVIFGLLTLLIVIGANLTSYAESENGNSPPVFTDGDTTTRSVAEKTIFGQHIGEPVAATDADNDTLAYTLSGKDAYSFTVVNTSGQLRTKAALDYETKSSYSVTITVSDEKGGTDTIDVTINVNDIVETTPRKIYNKDDVIMTLPDRDLWVPDWYSDLTMRAPGTILLVTLENGGWIEDGNFKYICVAENGGKCVINRRTVQEGKIEEISIVGKGRNGSPYFLEGAVRTTRYVAENTPSGTNIGTPVTAKDESYETLTYTLGGTDASSFSIVSTSGQLQTKAALDYETTTSYSVTITVSDGILEKSINVTINVTDVNETPANNAPVFTGTSTTRSVAENTVSGQNIGAAVAATDADGDTLDYTLGGDDAASFSIVSTSGQLQTKAALNYESKTSYSVTVSASDSNGGSDNIDVTIDVTNVNEAPHFAESRATLSIAENSVTGTNIGDAFNATDPDNGDTLTYSLQRSDASSFSIDSSTGQLKVKAALDYETQRSYTNLAVRATDRAGRFAAVIVTIDVTNVNEAPVFTEGDSTSRSVAENTASGTNIGDAVAATDVDGGTTLVYTLSGTDASSFSIVSTSGQLQTNAALDYETDTSYSVTITVSDGSLEDSINVTINVTDVNETPANNAPVFTGTSTTRSVAENTVSGQNIGAAVAATDADGDTLDYTLGGDDAASFRIVSTSGQLQTKAALNYESKTSYSVTVSVSDNKGGSDNIDVTIDVTNVNEAPVFTEGTTANRSVAENTAAGQNIGNAVAATDVDGGTTLVYTLGGDDAASFSIVSTSGQLQTKAALNYETTTSYSVTITVSDGTLEDSIDVTIDVTNVNEAAPVFTDGTTTTRSVAENTAAGQNIGDPVAATDADTGDVLVYTLSGDDAASFSIVSTSGQLQTKAALDYETDTSYSVTITVSDGSLTDNIDVTIDVTNVNEAAPVFTDGATATRSVAENTAANTNIGAAFAATDADTGDVLVYTLGGDDAASFRIVSTSGQLQTNAALNYESKTSYSVTVSVSDNNGGSDNIDVTIDVTNVNETPYFAESRATLSIAENSVTGTNIGDAFNATDPDNGDTLTYSLQRSDASSFSIDSSTGQLKVKAALDYETQRSYTNLAVRATDRAGRFAAVIVTVNVTNVNEAPVFTDGDSTSRSVAENTVSGTNIGDAVAATDVDGGTTLVYTLSGTDASSFSIVSTSGQLQTKAALDYETTTSYSVTITVSDGSLEDSINVTIDVTDVNETPANNAPVFTGTSTTRSVAENTVSGQNIGAAVAATDADNDTLVYTLSGDDAASFSIVSTSGQLQTNAALNYESKTSYSVTVSVSDNKGGSDNIDVTIDVTNVNEAPVFTEGTTANRSVAENTAANTNIGDAVAATDVDSNTTLVYTLSGDDAASFSIVSTSGQLQTNAALDYETDTSYSVTITVSDSSLEDSIDVTIDVTNVNEAAPVFTDGTTTTRSVAENTAAGQNIGDPVAATDADTGDVLVYTLGGDDAASFSIVSTSGQLQTKAALNYETDTSYSVTITVSDGSLEDSINVTIDVTNVNEAAPVFTDGATATRSVAENTAANTNIGAAFAATDADTGDVLVYTLGGDDAASFSVVRTSGQLQTKAALNYETDASYSVTITVSDGSLTDDIDVTIDVTNVNEAPVFTDGDSTSRSVAENTAAGQNIGDAVAATDVDGGTTLDYTLSGDDAASFSIVSTSGQLQTKAALDYETDTSYSVTITVSDGSLEDSIDVTIDVTNVNEAAPVFTDGATTTRSVAENTAAGQNIGDAVAATDADTGDVLVYTLSGDDAASFSIVSTSGQLQTKAALNYETDTSYSVTITVSDGSLEDSINVTIDVTNVNEAAPVFTDGATATRSVAENTAANTNIGAAFAATDADTGDVLVYTLGGDDAASFSIVRTSGQLQTKAALDYETDTSYSVTITVSDGSLTDDIDVTIDVTNVNEAPVFTDGDSTSRSVAENTAAGQNIGDAIAATDVDGGTTLVYTLSGDDAASFSIVSTSGQLQTKAALDYETTTSYSVTITVSDGSLEDSINVTINVTDVNETPANNAPVFTGTSTTRSVAENTAAGQNIGDPVAATDADGDTLDYTLGGDDAASFNIVSTSGQLQTKAALNYESKTSYSVTVSASDSNGGSDNIDVTIDVTNVNEAPSFAESRATLSIAENSVTGTNIGDAFNATDPDNGDTLTYSLVRSDASSFSIDSSTGQLKVKAALNYEAQRSYTNLVVRATDRAGRFAAIFVTVNVRNVNEAPTFTEGSTASRSVAENTAAGQNIGDAVAATDVDSNTTLIYTLAGDDAASFSIVSTSGQLQTKAALDYETDTSYSVTITVSDGTLEDSINVTIDVTNVNEAAPVFTDGATATRSVAENTAANTNIGAAFAATDADTGDTLVYTLGGDDAALFSVVSTSGQLQTKAALNYETTTSYSVTITVSDGSLTDEIDVTIDVTNVNEAPVFTDGDSTSRSVAENTAAGQNIGSAVAATDVDSNTILDYTLSGDDAASFSIVSTSGQLQTKTALDYETDTSYSVTITVSDGSLTDNIDVTINVTDVTEFTPVNQRTQQVQDAIVAVFRGLLNVDDITATHVAAITHLDLSGQSITSLKSGDFDGLTALRLLNLRNNSISDISALEDLTSLTSLFLSGNPITDYGPLRTLKATIVAAKRSILIDINLDNNPPVFTDGSSTTRLVAENTASGQNIGTAVAATDVDSGTTLVYTLGGTDASSFSIVSTSGHLQTNAALDYETKPSYTVTVDVSDGNNGLDRITVTINVTDTDEAGNDPPTFTEGSSTTRSVVENTVSSTNIGDAVAATDSDSGDALVYTLGGTDAASFSIVSTSGQLQTKAALDYETQTSYSVTVSVSDGNGGNDNITVIINVIDNTPPVFTDGSSTTRFVAENTVSGQNIGATVAATDVDSGTTLVYTLGGTDASSFSIVSTSGQLQTNAALDYETKSSYTVTVDVSDGNNGLDHITVTINVTDTDEAGNDPPTFTEGSSTTRSVAENTASSTNIGDAVAATDSDSGDILRYTLGGTDAASFSIVSTSGQLQTKAALDYETDSSYEVTVSVSDGNGGSDSITITIDVTDVTEFTPVNQRTQQVQDAIVAVFRGYLNVDDITAIHVAAISFLNLSGKSITSLKSGDFDGLTGLTMLLLQNNSISDISALEDLTSLQFLYLSGNPISDYGPLRTLKAAKRSIIIDINIDNNPPVFTDGDSTTRSIAENTAAGQNIGDAITATDADNHTLTYSLGGTDVDSFSIVSTSGQLQTKAALDYETKPSYTVTVTVYDGNSGGDRITVTIDVTDVANAAPSVETPPIIPDNTDLLTNFPNPFNPETWIPYQLAKPAEVTLTIYNMRGVVVRTIALGHKAAGLYTNRSRAIHWDGRNSIGEKVATGVYFYTLKAGDFTATRKMLIRK